MHSGSLCGRGKIALLFVDVVLYELNLPISLASLRRAAGVLTRATATPPVHCPGLPKTFTLGGTSVMEVEQ